jgi:hypothetical protein
MVSGQIWPLWKLEKYNGLKTWAGYISMFQNSSSFIYRNNPLTQRLATCKECGILIPREIPRIYLQASHSYRAGNYCVRCGITRLQDFKNDIGRDKKFIEEKMKELDKILDALSETKDDEYFKDKTDVLYLAKKISDK